PPPASAACAAALVGDVEALLAARGVALGPAPGDAACAADADWIRIGPELTHVVGPEAAIEALRTALPEAPEALATLAEIELGLPAVPPALAGHYVAQMLNLDVLDAVAFDKGCFPGQEVIARTHNLGAVKRRLRRFSAPLASPPP